MEIAVPALRRSIPPCTAQSLVQRNQGEFLDVMFEPGAQVTPRPRPPAHRNQNYESCRNEPATTASAKLSKWFLSEGQGRSISQQQEERCKSWRQHKARGKCRRTGDHAARHDLRMVPLQRERNGLPFRPVACWRLATASCSKVHRRPILLELFPNSAGKSPCRVRATRTRVALGSTAAHHSPKKPYHLCSSTASQSTARCQQQASCSGGDMCYCHRVGRR